MKPEGGVAALAAQDVVGIRYAGLTALRGIAACMVVLVHVWGIHQFAIPGAVHAVVSRLTLGVPLFFVLSAFSLYVSTMPRVERPGWINDFLIRRFMRIAPLFYLMSLFFFICIPLITGGPHAGGRFLLTITFLFGFMPGYHESNVWAGWSVGVEMIFYLMLPLLLVTIRSLRSSAIFAFLSFLIGGAFIDHFRKADYPENYDWFSFAGALGVFAAGILGYFIVLALRDRPRRKLWGNAFLVAAIATGALMIKFETALTDDGPFTLLLCSGLPFMFLVISQVLGPVGLITNRVFVHLGDLSFSLYLLHAPIIYFSKPVYEWIFAQAGQWIGFALCVAFTFAVLYPAAQIAYRLIERPGIRYREAWITRRRARDVTLPVMASG